MALYPTHVELNEKEAQKLIKLYKRSYNNILQSLNGATDFTIANRKGILAQITAELKTLSKKTGEIIEIEIPEQYKVGADQAVMQLSNIGANVRVKDGFNLVNKRAIAALVDDTAKSFAEALTTTGREARNLLDVIARDEIIQQLATSQIKGESLRKATRAIKGLIAEQGVTGLIDKSGKKWDLDRYAEMLYRTKLVESRNRGLINRMVENGFDLVQVSSHQGSCGICAPYEGQIYSITGNTEGYQKLDTITSRPGQVGLFHPHCRHAINTITPSVARAINAYNGKEVKVIPPSTIRKKSNIKPAKPPKDENNLVKTTSGVMIRQATSINPIIKASEAVRYNAAYQVDGLRTLAQLDDIPIETISAIDEVDVSTAKNPTEAAELIIKALPKEYKKNPQVEKTILQWGRQLLQALQYKGVLK